MFPLLNKTHYSFAYCTPAELIEAASKAGYRSCGICDPNLSGVVEFIEAADKHGIKPIIAKDFSGDSKLICIAKNKKGWHELLKIKNPKEDLKGTSLIVISDSDEYFLTNDFFLWDEVALNNTHYILPEHKEFYDIMVLLDKGEPDERDRSFPFEWDADDIQKRNNEKIESLCEKYSIFNPPILPKFPCPDGFTEDEFLKQLCRNGWHKVKENHEVYKERVLHELNVISRSNLTGYFLIVWDFVRQSRQNRLVNVRGSAAGCLVSYLIGISDVDPIKHNLIFERFFDASRSYPKHVSFEEHSFIDRFRS